MSTSEGGTFQTRQTAGVLVGRGEPGRRRPDGRTATAARSGPDTLRPDGETKGSERHHLYRHPVLNT
jgi:hypothetical protein